jgi:two-component system sensor histidine kinase VicK
VEKTEILHGQDIIKKRTINDFHLIQNRLDNCTDSTGPYVIDTPLWNEFLELKKKAIKLRLITEITKDNIGYSKKIVKVFETRHLDEVKGNFGIADGREYGGGASITKGEPPIEFIRSNVKAFVDQQQFFFETLWNKAIPAEQRIREIDEGIEPIKTKILGNYEEIYRYIAKSIEKSNQLYICSSIGGLHMVYNNFFNSYKEIIGKQKRQDEYNGVKWLTFIDDNKNSINLVKKFINAGIQIRHIKNLPSMNFSVDSNNIHATIGGMDKDGTIDKLLVSNEPAYINHFISYFQDLWNNQGIDAKERIKDIEEGMEYDIEVIRHSDRTLNIYLNIVKSSRSEILFILPTPRAFVRQFKTMYLASQVSKERKVKVRILTPKDEIVENYIKHLLKEENGNSNDSIVSNSDGDLKVRYIEQMSYTKSSIVIVDRKESLVMELKDDTKDSFNQAIGLSTHSTSKASVLSYVAIFENLWKQSELYQEIKETNEKLESKDKVLNEFIHIASHEIRNPIQPILILSQLVKSELSKKIESGTDKNKIFNFLDIIIRNAKKLNRLTDDVLDIAKIETNSLILNIEIFNLKDLIQDLIDDYKSQQKNDTCNIELYFNIDGQQRDLDNNLFLIGADKARISQVVSNLLINALKFTNKDCLIQVTIERKLIGRLRKEAIVTIKDTGTGIDPEIIPILFTKFASKSDKGTGLGLYICKNIVDAHGGKIWAKNNDDRKGATFSFSLPLDN